MIILPLGKQRFILDYFGEAAEVYDCDWLMTIAFHESEHELQEKKPWTVLLFVGGIKT